MTVAEVTAQCAADAWQRIAVHQGEKGPIEYDWASARVIESRDHLPVERFYAPEEFDAFKAFGESLGFRHVEAGPLVRSSYHAEKQARILLKDGTHD